MIQKKFIERDISPKALKASVYKQAAQAPLTAYSSSLAALSSFYLLLMGFNPLALGGLIAGGSVAFGHWLWKSVIKGESQAAIILNQYRAQLENERNEAILYLNKELRAIDDAEALKQVELFRDKFANFTRILVKKFQPEELTYNRYLSIAEQVFLGGLSNLENACVAQQSVKAIDLDHITSQLGKFDPDKDKETIASLQGRIDLWHTQNDKARDLKKQNEMAMTQLDAVSARLANINTASGSDTVQLEDAMEELKRLIARAENYSRQN